MEELRCIGCGSIIQTSNPKQAGYVPQSKIEESEDLVCRRCFRLRNYNEVLPTEITKEDYFRIISSIGETNALIVKIIDIFDIEGSLIPQIQKLTNHNDLVVIANKVDLLPKSVKEAKLKHHLQKILADNNIKTKEIMIMSAIKNKNLDSILDSIIKLADKRDIYIVGATNVGKSTFINQILKNYTDEDKEVITVSASAGTTLDLIQIPLGDFTIYDTPGLVNEEQITHYVSQETSKYIHPKKEVKPKNYQLDPGQTLFIGGLSRLDFVSGVHSSFTVYVSSMLNVHRTKLENADQLYTNRLYEVLTPPFKGEEYPLKSHDFYIKEDKKYDIVLPGLGFVTIKGKGKIKVYTLKHSRPYMREALI